VTRPDQLVEAIRAGDRRALARAITLVESTRADHRDQALAVLEALLPDAGRAIRVGISGAPGVGKSTFIEAFGVHLVGAGHQVAVLAVDPSSSRSGGSILGDKTRMTELANSPAAFIRPSPSGGSLGGVARRTREAMLLCEAFGFDAVLIETVGVGQSESAVDDLVDVFVLLVQPGGGDELQGIKRGVTELADVLVVTKADGEMAAAARRAATEYGRALHYLRPKHAGWRPPVVSTSALTGAGIDEVWAAVLACHGTLEETGALPARREAQTRAWFWSELTDQVLDRFRSDPSVARLLPRLEDEVAAGRTSPSAAARKLVEGEDAVSSTSAGAPG
jgi:LAO/AO transport system kinase